MDLIAKNELVLVPDLHERLRQLRWFRTTFRDNAKAVTARYGINFDIDDKKLTRIFLDWVEVVNEQKSYATIDRADFVVFAAGLALREMIRHAPARSGVTPEPQQAIPDIVRFWPEGFVYTNYSICAIAAVLEQEYGKTIALDACIDDLRTWWSYKENTKEMPSYAVSFLDRFLGIEPEWPTPDCAGTRGAMRRALAADQRMLQA